MLGVVDAAIASLFFSGTIRLAPALRREKIISIAYKGVSCGS